MKFRPLAALALFAIALIACAEPARAFEVDPTFGSLLTPGRVTASFDRANGNRKDTAMALLRRADGNLLVFGHAEPTADDRLTLAIAVLSPNGLLISKHLVTTPLIRDPQADNDQMGLRAGIDVLGRLYLSSAIRDGAPGLEASRFAVLRLLPDFTIDATYGTQGIASIAIPGTAPGERALPLDMVVSTGGTATLAGTSFRSAAHAEMVVARLDGSGAPASAFGGDGIALVPFDLVATPRDSATRVAVDREGRILVAGIVRTDGDANSSVTLARLQTNGTLDASFCPDASTCDSPVLGGRRLLNFRGERPGNDLIHALATTPDGGILIAGEGEFGSGPSRQFVCALMKFRANGAIDTNFGEEGLRVVLFGVRTNCTPRQLLVGPNGAITLIGNDASFDLTARFAAFFAARFHADGSEDVGFAPGQLGGVVRVEFPVAPHNEAIAADALFDGERIVIAGSRRFAGANGNDTLDDMDFAIARLRDDTIFRNSFD